MANLIGKLLDIVTPKGKPKTGGTALTPTHNLSNPDQVLTVPVYRDHLTDIFASRQADDSRDLMRALFKHDPDVSAAVNSYLTMANTQPIIVVRDLNEQIDKAATLQIMQVIRRLTQQVDYTQGFQFRQALNQFTENCRYMLLLRGAIGVELILDKKMLPWDLRQIDMASIEWREKTNGVYKPEQKIAGRNEGLKLDLPTFFVAYYRRDPTSIYAHSHFVAAINTIAARQQVINDLYRIMQVTGFPRIHVSVLEEVLLKNAPANVQADAEKLKNWKAARLAEVQALFATVRADQAIIHYDSIEPKILNDRSPGAALNVSGVIETLNSQNQAALKTMATVIGRGTQGVNTGSVEARVAAMNADELNEPIADLLAQVFSFILHQQGYQGFCDVTFKKAELRPDLELEPHLTMRQARLKADLSLGLITDAEYALWMYGRLSPDSAPELSGTLFDAPQAKPDPSQVSPNQDSLGRSLTPKGSKAAKSNTVK